MKFCKTLTFWEDRAVAEWKYSYSVSQKTRPLQLMWHNVTNSQSSLIIFGTERPYSVLRWVRYKVFLNWLRTSCVVSITTAANWHIWTADFWAEFEQRIINSAKSAINNWQDDCEAVSMPKDSRNMCCNFWYRKTFYYSDRNAVCLRRFPFSAHKVA